MLKWLLKILEKDAYQSDQEGIMSRYLREVDHWDNHLLHTKNAIIDSIKVAKNGKIAVLGSGWLLDVPMNELLEHFGSVHLYDIVHPKQILHKYRNIPAVKFVVKDLTGGLIELAKESATYEAFKNKVDLSNLLLDFEGYDMVISLNLLNQLDIILIDFLTKKFKVIDQNVIWLRKFIQQNHIRALPQGKSCLISDFKEFNYTKEGDLIKKTDLIFVDLHSKNKVSEWIWIFDTTQRYRKHCNTSFKVGHYLL